MAARNDLHSHGERSEKHEEEFSIVLTSNNKEVPQPARGSITRLC